MTARVRKSATRRRLVGVLGLLTIAAVAAIVYVQIASAAVTVTAATGGTSISADKAANAASPSYTALGNIVITEGNNGDFATPQTNKGTCSGQPPADPKPTAGANSRPQPMTSVPATNNIHAGR